MARGRRDRSLARRKPYLQPRRRFTIFCEGKNTEPTYFDALRDRHKDALIAVKTIGKGVSPSGVAAAAAAFAAAHPPRDSFEEGDQVWAVFDRDTHKDFDAAVKACGDGGVGIARSNPCFEVWLILHVEDYHRPDGSGPVQKHLQRLRPEYDRRKGKCPDCAALILEVAKAEARAEALLARQERDGAPFGNPSTTVFRLTREIRAAAEASARKR